MRSGFRGRLDHRPVIHSRRGTPEYVMTDSIIKENRFLRDIPKATAPSSQRQGLHWTTRDAYTAPRWLIQPQQTINQGGFARPRTPDDADGGAFGKFHRDAI